jgi:hypothetical protein
MNSSRHAQAAWLDRSACPSGLPHLQVRTDKQRAPLSFGWWSRTTTDRISKYFHIETLYRLDRQQCERNSTHLVPSGFYAMDECGAREYLLARQNALLPRLPSGYAWVGPVLIEDVQGSPGEVDEPFHTRVMPQASRARLAVATNLAAAVLRQRGMLAEAA